IGIGVDLSGLTVDHFWVGLTLLGVGWNFLFIGATTLLTETYRSEERAKVQALNDFCVFTATAAGAFSAGALQFHIGWELMHYGALSLVVAALVALALIRRAARRPAVA